MSVRLKDRNRQVPNGYKFYQAETKWSSRPWASFNEIVSSLIAHRKANPALVKKYNWATDQENVEDEVDAFNANICYQMGYTDYYVSDGGQTDPAPFRQSPSAKLRNVAGGAELLVEWISSGAEAVPQSEAESRAKTCAECKHNAKGDLLSFFTRPVSAAIRNALGLRGEWKLKTSQDEKLNVCEVCSCPLALKVWVPEQKIRDHMDKEIESQLPETCWLKQPKNENLLDDHKAAS